jgi:hypothetical protein
MRKVTCGLDSKGKKLTPFEQADYNLTRFAEHVTFHSQLKEILDRIKAIDSCISSKGDKTNVSYLIMEKQVLTHALESLLDSYSDFVYEA